MTSTRKTPAGLTAAILVAFLVSGCGSATPSAPRCSAEATRYKVLRKAFVPAMVGRVQWVDENRIAVRGDTLPVELSQGRISFTDPTSEGETGKKMILQLRNVRATDRNKAVGSWACEAEFVMDITKDEWKATPTVIYSSELANGGSKHYVEGSLYPNGRQGRALAF